jgi:transposase InsO family protein
VQLTAHSNAHAERFVRSIKEECLDRLIPFGEGHFRRALTEFLTHYHRERNHQGLGNALIDGDGSPHPVGTIRRRHRLGGLLSYDYRAASSQPPRCDWADLSDITVLRCRQLSPL